MLIENTLGNVIIRHSEVDLIADGLIPLDEYRLRHVLLIVTRNDHQYCWHFLSSIDVHFLWLFLFFCFLLLFLTAFFFFLWLFFVFLFFLEYTFLFCDFITWTVCVELLPGDAFLVVRDGAMLSDGIVDDLTNEILVGRFDSVVVCCLTTRIATYLLLWQSLSLLFLWRRTSLPSPLHPPFLLLI